MNRYRVSRADFPAVKQYLAGKSFKKDAPSFARKFKDDLKFKGNVLYFKDQKIIPTEDVDDYLRAEFYDPKSSYHHLEKLIFKDFWFSGRSNLFNAVTVRARKPRRPSGRRGFRARTVTPRAKRDLN